MKSPNSSQPTPQRRNRRTALRYIFFDTLSAVVAWALLFLFRKVGLENLRFTDLGQVLADSNFWRGIVIVPLGWLALYTIQGTYARL